MAIFNKLLHLDELYAQTETKQLVTDFIHNGEEGLIELKESLMTTYNSDEISMLPSCVCGYYSKQYLNGHICPKCEHKVVSNFSNFSPTIYMHVYNNKDRWISPIIIAMVHHAINSPVRLLRWIGDTRYNPPLGKHEALFLSLNNIKGFERSYEWLCKNIPTVLNFLISSPILKQKKDKIKMLEVTLVLYNTNKNVLFSKHLPLLNKKMFVLINTGGMGTFGNNGVGTTLDIALDYIKGFKSSNDKVRQNIMMKILDKDSNLYNTIVAVFFSGKGGIFRKNLHGARCPFTSRSVIVPRTGVHDADTVLLPWGIGVTKFRLHILPFLLKNGHTYLEASKLLYTSVKKYNKEIADILDNLIKLCPLKGIPMSHQRNPSLEQGSSVTVYIIGFKKDPFDTSTENSSGLCKIYSGDFDGDEMNNYLHLDHKVHNMFKSFEAHHSVSNPNIPYEISGRVTLTDPGIALVSNAIESQRKEKGV